MSEKEIVPRRRVITMRELEKYGFTPGCAGCEAKRRGGIAKSGHSEECRKRVEAKMNDDEVGRAMLDQTRQKFVEHTARKIEKEEDRKRKVQNTEAVTDKIAVEEEMECQDEKEEVNEPTAKKVKFADEMVEIDVEDTGGCECKQHGSNALDTEFDDNHCEDEWWHLRCCCSSER